MDRKFREINWKNEQSRIDSLRTKFLEPDIEEDELKYQTIIDYCKQFDTVFHDGEFPHTEKNLGKQMLKVRKRQSVRTKKKLKSLSNQEMAELREKADYSQLDQLKKNCKASWLRPLKIPTKQRWEFRCAHLLYEIDQNGLGNCGLMAVLSAISPHLKLLNFIFREMELSEYGVYQVKLCIDGAWESIVLDDFMPYIGGILRSADSFSPLFGHRQLWPALIEKALAKVYGGYDRLQGFDMELALLNITGAPVMEYSLSKNMSESKSEKLWNKMVEANINNFPMVCGSNKKKKTTKKSTEPKISDSHGFTIIKTREFKSHRLILLRNPWGTICWTGKWSPDWPGWDDESFSELILSERDISGTFWIEFEDFLKYFDTVTISRWRSSWNEIRVPVGGLWDDSHKVIRITVPKTCQLCVSAIRPNHENNIYATWISIHEICPDEPEEIGVIIMFEPVSNTSKEVQLLPGYYLILVSNVYKTSSKEERNVAIHSSLPIHAKICSWSPKMLIEVFHRMTSEYGREIIKKRDDISIKKFSKDNEFMIVLAQNFSYEKYFHVHIRYPRMEKDKYSRGDTYDYNFGDVIPPRSKQILMIIYRYNRSEEVGFPMMIEYCLSEEKAMKIRREKRAAHIPTVGAADYIHQTVVME